MLTNSTRHSGKHDLMPAFNELARKDAGQIGVVFLVHDSCRAIVDIGAKAALAKGVQSGGGQIA
jgi:hypothetical protein